MASDRAKVLAKAQSALRQEVRHGLRYTPEDLPHQKALQAAAQERSDAIWSRVKKVSGLVGKAPKVEIGKANEVRGGNRLSLTASTAAAILGIRAEGVSRKEDPNLKVDTTGTILHEDAHIGQMRSGHFPGQTARYPGTDTVLSPKAEGRADRFEKKTLKKLKIGSKAARKSLVIAYPKWDKRSQKRDAKDEVLYGQFGEASPQQKHKVAKKLHKAASHVSAGVLSQIKDLGPDAVTLARTDIKLGKKGPVPASVLFNQQGIESGWGADIVGPDTPYGNARGWSQFIPSTRESIVEKYGVDPWKSPQQSAKAQSLLLRDAGYASDPSSAVFSYNHLDSYVNEVLSGASQYTALDKATTKPIPKALKRQAKEVLGAKRTHSIIQGGGSTARPDTSAPASQVINKAIKRYGKGDVVRQPQASAGGALAIVDKGNGPEIYKALQALSAKLKTTVYVTSGYRTDAQNANIPGASAGDPHSQGNAFDIGVGSPTIDSVASVPEKVLNSVGLYRPYYPASSAEANHVELIGTGDGTGDPAEGGGTPYPAVTGGTSTGVSTGTSTGISTGTGGAALPPDSSSAPGQRGLSPAQAERLKRKRARDLQVSKDRKKVLREAISALSGTRSKPVAIKTPKTATRSSSIELGLS